MQALKNRTVKLEPYSISERALNSNACLINTKARQHTLDFVHTRCLACVAHSNLDITWQFDTQCQSHCRSAWPAPQKPASPSHKHLVAAQTMPQSHEHPLCRIKYRVGHVMSGRLWSDWLSHNIAGRNKAPLTAKPACQYAGAGSQRPQAARQAGPKSAIVQQSLLQPQCGLHILQQLSNGSCMFERQAAPVQARHTLP